MQGRTNLFGATADGVALNLGGFASSLISDIVVLDRDSQIANTSTVSVDATGSLAARPVSGVVSAGIHAKVFRLLVLIGLWWL